MAKRRHRRTFAVLSSPPKEHRSRAHSFYQRAVDAHAQAKGASVCSEAIGYLASAMRQGDLAAEHLHSVGASAGRGHSSKRKFAGSLDRLRKQLAKDFRSVMQRCVRKYPEA